MLKDGKLYTRTGTGVLIGPRTVVTAAHTLLSVYDESTGSLLEGVPVGRVKVSRPSNGRNAAAMEGKVFIHDSIAVSRKKDVIAMSDQDLSRFLRDQTGIYDVAVIGLAEPLGARGERYPVITSEHPRVLNKYRFTGINLRDGAGDLPFALSTIATRMTRYAVAARISFDGALRTHRTQAGDSGGPLYGEDVDGAVTLFGVASSSRSNVYGVWVESVYSRLDQIRDWVLSRRAVIDG
ncbi:MAG: trypsin-like serine protease, partial [Gammaproteobacteria bacterium]